MFLTVVVDPGGEDSIRALLGDVAVLSRSVGSRAPEAELSCVVGIGSDLFDRLFAAPRPLHLHPFRALNGRRHTAVSTHADLLFHLRARRSDLVFELGLRLTNRLRGHAKVVDETHGFRYFDQRNLLGFVDGTENPVDDDAAHAVLIGEQDPSFSAGSYVVVQKYLHDLDEWERLPSEMQERVIGRRKLSNTELPDVDRPADSHVAINTQVDENGAARQILRDNMPFGHLSGGPGSREVGTYFIGYSADPTTIEAMLERMFLGDPAGVTDRMLDYSRAVTGALFFVPSLTFLDDLPPSPGTRSRHIPPVALDAAGTTARPAANHDIGFVTSARPDGSLGLGNLKQEISG